MDHFHNGATGKLLGGLYRNGSITEEQFLTILTDDVLIALEGIEIKARNQQVMSPTNNSTTRRI